jgi:type II restriction enzyme
LGNNLLNSTIPRLQKLTDGQLGLLNLIIDTFDQPIAAQRLEASDVVNEPFLVAFGDFLKLHHSLSDEYLDKTRFETAVVRIYGALGRRATRTDSRTNRGHDITVDGSKWALKTHGDKKIRPDKLFISKFMELNRGQWGKTDLNDLSALRDQFMDHLAGYDRIFQLRYFHDKVGESSPEMHRYEFVEIPKSLFQEAARGDISFAARSKAAVRCGYCTVSDQERRIKFRLYFDGGGERKLQIKDLRKDLCIVHAAWQFSPNSPLTSPAAS